MTVRYSHHSCLEYGRQYVVVVPGLIRAGIIWRFFSERDMARASHNGPPAGSRGRDPGQEACRLFSIWTSNRRGEFAFLCECYHSVNHSYYWARSQANNKFHRVSRLAFVRPTAAANKQRSNITTEHQLDVVLLRSTHSLNISSSVIPANEVAMAKMNNMAPT